MHKRRGRFVKRVKRCGRFSAHWSTHERDARETVRAPPQAPSFSAWRGGPEGVQRGSRRGRLTLQGSGTSECVAE
eukprot:1185085-Prorocentrum_minimum.AAC.1